MKKWMTMDMEGNVFQGTLEGLTEEEFKKTLNENIQCVIWEESSN